MPKALVPAQRIGAEEEMAGKILYLARKGGLGVGGWGWVL
jgi:hypothetical protein